jgi:hypothetical protein
MHIHSQQALGTERDALFVRFHSFATKKERRKNIVWFEVLRASAGGSRYSPRSLLSGAHRHAGVCSHYMYVVQSLAAACK